MYPKQDVLMSVLRASQRVLTQAILFPRQTIAVKPAAALPKGPAPSAAHKEYQGPIIKEGGKRRFTAATAMSQENGSMLKVSRMSAPDDGPARGCVKGS